jgi:shikimate dehydrogenase/3-dehydroquinate dehydratase type I
VAALAPRRAEDLSRLIARVPAGADAIEYRLDLAAEPIAPARLLQSDPRPVIVTYRSSDEGGGFVGGAEEYRRLVAAAYDAGAVVDVELSSGLLADPTMLPDRRRVVASLHAPFGLPEDWESRLSAMLATGAAAAKLVAGAADLAASLRIADLQRRQTERRVALFPMGPASAPGRVLSALFGSALVYGPVEAPTASGQLPLEELLSVYRVDEPREITSLFGIVGQEGSGSLSPLLHNALFRRRGLPALYLPLPVADWERSQAALRQFEPAFRGLSVTRPWKRHAALAGALAPDAEATGAANTLWLERGTWRADNTDVDGLFDPLADHDTGEGRVAVLLGAGGTCRAAVVAARRLGYEILVASRRDAEADALARELGVDSLAWADVALTEADLYVNTTPAGSEPNDPPAVPPAVLESRPLVFDCVYRRDGRETATIRAARAAGCRTIDGLSMFAAQAIRQARIFGVTDAREEELRAILRGATDSPEASA